ncbi:MAG: hypothetical protein COW65_13625 [Cytophagales bacterium CG18_big_fil_WC_8_21_14_2_50_42_9]|nr:MAG: hypothetical protein COW65_13625 [Cytophagales bacterium CG18_big_fil_WC_8_21_14_2_50_42_9]
MQHIKQLDSLRGIAVLLVMLSHWIPTPASQMGAFMGVNTFFVLSGFLISNILFINKNAAEATGHSKLIILKNFIFRRALRIFPIYFLVVISLAILGESRIPGIHYDLKYLLTFTSNFHTYLVKHFGKYTAHLWSLAVEEQFYLVWPWLMLFLKRKYIPLAILIFILTGTISDSFVKDGFGYLLTHTCLSAFGLGALLSWVYICKPQFLAIFFRLLNYIIIAELVIVLLFMFGLPFPALPLRTMLSIVALWVITHIVINNQGGKKLKFSFLLNSNKLIFIGKISYGVYLYHIYVPYLTSGFLNYLQIALPYFLKPYAFIFYLISNLCIAFGFSWLSWRYLEIPIMRLKRYFEYQAPKSPRFPGKPQYA